MKPTRIFLFLISLLAVIAVRATVPYDFTVGGVYYSFINGTADEVGVTYRAYSEYANTYKGAVVIPETVVYDGKTYRVTQIEMLAMQNCKSLTSVTLPEGLVSIGSLAFENCVGLREIVFPASLQLIANHAFRGCTGLESVRFEGGIDEIMRDVFMNCRSLRSVTLPEGTRLIGASAFSGCSALEEIGIPSTLEGVGSGAFDGTPWLKSRPDGPLYLGKVLYKYMGSALIGLSVDVPEGIVSISPSAFWDARNLASIRLPGTLREIGASAFFNSSLTEVTIPESVTELGSACFANCAGLARVNYNAVEAHAGKDPAYGTFAYCFSLRDVTIGDEVRVIPESVFAYTGIEHLELPASVKTVADFAFYGCTGLVTTTLGAVETIGEKAFAECSSLLSVEIPSTTVSVGASAFLNCDSMVTAIIGANVKELGMYSFSHLDKRAGYVALPKLVKGILLCNSEPTGLRDSRLGVRYNTTNTPNLNMMFVSKGVRYLPLSVKDRTCAAIDCVYSPDVTEITIGERVSMSRGSATVEFTVAQTNVYAVAHNPYLRKLTVTTPSCDVAGHFADGCANLEQVTLSNGGNLGDYAFYNCGQATVASGHAEGGRVRLYNTGSIGIGAFQNCMGLTDLEVGPTVTSIGSSAFSGCRATERAVLNNSGSIGAEAFYGAESLREVHIARSVGNIGERAFMNSMSTPVDRAVVVLDNTGSIGAEAFDGCTSIGSLYVGSGVTDIFAGAFTGSGCTDVVLHNIGSIYDNAFARSGVTTVSLGDSVAAVGKAMFRDCRGLTSVRLSKRLKELPENMFYGCSNLGGIVIPDSVEYVRANAFYGCGALEAITIPVSVRSVETGAFDRCTSLKHLVLEGNRGTEPGSLASVGHGEALSLGRSGDYMAGTSSHCGMFSGSPIETLVMSRNIAYDARYISGYSPFYGISTLRRVEMSPQVTSIGNYLFSNCTSIERMDFSPEITTIGDEAFAGCTALPSLRLGAKVASIGSRAFNACIGLREFGVEAEVPPTCGEGALGGIDKWECTLYVPANSVDAYYAAEQWDEFFFINDISDMPSGDSHVAGDIDGDGAVTVTDVVIIVNCCLELDATDEQLALCDLNGDGTVSIADVVLAVNLALAEE